MYISDNQYIKNSKIQNLITKDIYTKSSVRIKLFYELLRFCGFTSQEAIILRVKDVKDKSEIYTPDLICYKNAKSFREITLDFTPYAQELIAQILSQHSCEPDDYILALKDVKKPPIQQVFINSFDRTSKKYGCHVTPNLLRKCYIYDLFSKYNGKSQAVFNAIGNKSYTLVRQIRDLYYQQENDFPDMKSSTGSTVLYPKSLRLAYEKDKLQAICNRLNQVYQSLEQNHSSAHPDNAADVIDQIDDLSIMLHTIICPPADGDNIS